MKPDRVRNIPRSNYTILKPGGKAAAQRIQYSRVILNFDFFFKIAVVTILYLKKKLNEKTRAQKVQAIFVAQNSTSWSTGADDDVTTRFKNILAN